VDAEFLEAVVEGGDLDDNRDVSAGTDGDAEIGDLYAEEFVVVLGQAGAVVVFFLVRTGF